MKVSKAVEILQTMDPTAELVMADHEPVTKIIQSRDGSTKQVIITDR